MAMSTTRARRGTTPTFYVVTILLLGGCLALLAVGWSYYLTPLSARPTVALHRLMASRGIVGLATGILAFVLFVFNLLYLLRQWLAARAAWVSAGTLRRWLNWHTLSGLAGGAYTACHATLHVRSELTTVAVIALAVVIVTGAVGRFLLRLAPRARAGEDLDLSDLREGIGSLAAEGLDREARAGLERLRAWAERPAVEASVPWQVLDELQQVRRDLTPLLLAGPDDSPVHHLAELVEHLLGRARGAHRGSLLFDIWRPLHRVVAIVFVLSLVIHIGWAVREGYLGL